MRDNKEYHYVTIRMPLPLYYYLMRVSTENGEKLGRFLLMGLAEFARACLRNAIPSDFEYLPEDLEKQIAKQLK